MFPAPCVMTHFDNGTQYHSLCCIVSGSVMNVQEVYIFVPNALDTRNQKKKDKRDIDVTVYMCVRDGADGITHNTEEESI